MSAQRTFNTLTDRACLSLLGTSIRQRKNPLPDFFVAFKWVGGRTNCKNQGGVLRY